MIRTVGRGPWKIRTRQYQVPHRQRRPHGEHDRVPPQRAPDVPARRPTATGTAMMRFEGADGAPTSTVTGSWWGPAATVAWATAGRTSPGAPQLIRAPILARGAPNTDHTQPRSVLRLPATT